MSGGVVSRGTSNEHSDAAGVTKGSMSFRKCDQMQEIDFEITSDRDGWVDAFLFSGSGAGHGTERCPVA
jgi:hypothetical protein